MPRLDNAKHERVAQLIAEGRTSVQAYVEAGCRTKKQRSMKTVQKSAYEMARRPYMRLRIAELRDEIAQRHVVTTEKIIQELEDARVHARSFGQASAMVQAAMGKARLAGLLIERVHHTGGVATRMELDLTRLSTEQLRALRALLGRVALTTENSQREGVMVSEDEGDEPAGGESGATHEEGSGSGSPGAPPPSSNGAH